MQIPGKMLLTLSSVEEFKINATVKDLQQPDVKLSSPTLVRLSWSEAVSTAAE